MTPATQSDRNADPVIPEGSPKELPGPRGLKLLRKLHAMRSATLPMLGSTIEEYGDAVWLPMGRLNMALLNDPDHVAHILKANAKNYRKSQSYRELALVLGQGLLTSEGEFWKRQRRIAQPSFRKKQIAGFTPTITAETTRTLSSWDEQVDIGREMVRLTLGIVGRAFFSTDLGADADLLGEAMRVCLPVVQDRTEAILNLPMWLPLPSHLRFRRKLGEMDQRVQDLIEERQRQGEADAPRDLLSMLVFAKDPETGQAMHAKQVRDEIVTFLLAGHETTAHALAWTFTLLALHPDIARRVREEVDAVLGDRTPNAEDTTRLELTRRVLLESMRLYPPAWMIEREALEDDVVGGFRIPKGTLVMLSTYTVHRHRDHWQDPERFDPDRFLPERAAGRHKCAYFPFGAGQRQCIGEGFAMLEMLLIVPMIVRAFDLELVDPAVVDPEPGITLRPRHPIHMRLRTRR